MAKITKITYDLPDYLKRGGGLIISSGPASKRLHDAMRKAGEVAPPPEKHGPKPEDSKEE